MRVVIVNDASLARGGATALALLEAELLRARGVEVVFAGRRRWRQSDVRADWRAQRPAWEKSACWRAGGISAIRGLYNRRTPEVLGPVFAAAGPKTIYHVHGWSRFCRRRCLRRSRPIAAASSYPRTISFWPARTELMPISAPAAPCALTPLSLACVGTNATSAATRTSCGVWRGSSRNGARCRPALIFRSS